MLIIYGFSTDKQQMLSKYLLNKQIVEYQGFVLNHHRFTIFLLCENMDNYFKSSEHNLKILNLMWNPNIDKNVSRACLNGDGGLIGYPSLYFFFRMCKSKYYILNICDRSIFISLSQKCFQIYRKIKLQLLLEGRCQKKSSHGSLGESPKPIDHETEFSREEYPILNRETMQWSSVPISGII